MFLITRSISVPLIAFLLACTISASAQNSEPNSQAAPAAGEPEPATTSAPAADTDGWKVQVIPFAWLPKTNLSVSYGNRSFNTLITPSQAVSKLEFALAGAVAAQNGPWGVMGEGLYVNSASDVDFRRVSGSLRSNMTLVQGSGSYRLLDEDGFTLDGVAGLRFYDFGFNNSFTRDGAIFTQNFESRRSKSWLDPVIGLRTSVPFNEELSLNLYGDLGGFGVGSDLSWRAQAVFGYNVSDSVALNLGYSALGARYQQGSGSDLFKINFTSYGPVLGATFKL